jgi:hypothetical protein
MGGTTGQKLSYLFTPPAQNTSLIWIQYFLVYQKLFWCQIIIMEYDQKFQGIFRLFPESNSVMYYALFKTVEYVTISTC